MHRSGDGGTHRIQAARRRVGRGPWAEILYAVRHELAETLADILLRRTMVAYGPVVALDVDRAGRKVKEFREYIRRYNPRYLRGMQPQEI